MVNVASDTALLVLKTLLNQLDLASIAYVFYQCVSLWFPSPLILFRSSLLVASTRFLFGAQKTFFLSLVLAICWGWSYLKAFNVPAILSVYMENCLRDPCLANPEYSLRVGREGAKICDEMIEMQAEWTFQTETIRQTLSLVDLMSECQCSFPFEYLRDLMPTSSSEAAEVQYLGFGRPATDGFCAGDFGSNCKFFHEVVVTFDVATHD